MCAHVCMMCACECGLIYATAGLGTEPMSLGMFTHGPIFTALTVIF